jgi:hypothetical protein
VRGNRRGQGNLVAEIEQVEVGFALAVVLDERQ